MDSQTIKLKLTETFAAAQAAETGNITADPDATCMYCGKSIWLDTDGWRHDSPGTMPICNHVPEPLSEAGAPDLFSAVISEPVLAAIRLELALQEFRAQGALISENLRQLGCLMMA